MINIESRSSLLFSHWNPETPLDEGRPSPKGVPELLLLILLYCGKGR
jgi:hypothetical protein